MSEAVELALTLAVETPIVAALAGAAGVRRRSAALACALANLATQPLFHLAVTHLPPEGAPRWRSAVAGGEGLVWLAEAAIYLALLPDLRRARRGWARALAISLAANAASAGLGLALPL